MNKLEVGMYARTTELYGGLISHITKVCEETKTVMLYGTGVAQYPFKEIQKASHNIIDLIEVGDYVNGIMVNGKTNDKVQVAYICHNEELNYHMPLTFDVEDIKSIVTKEQISSVEYRLGE